MADTWQTRQTNGTHVTDTADTWKTYDGHMALTADI